MPEFKETEFSQPINQVVMPLIAVRNGADEYTSGSAFLIGRGWAVTAYHVVEDFAERYDGVRLRSGSTDISFEMLGYLALDGGKRILPLKVLRAWRAEPLDIAVLALGVPQEWPDNHIWKIPVIDLLPPPVGASIVGFGFANGKIEKNGPGDPATLTIAPSTSTGTVLEIHHRLRDSSRLPFPCFRTNARFDGGMSGGPVLNNQTGRVCGVICSSLPATTDDEEHVSYASTLWPLLATLVDASATTVNGATPYPLAKLYENGTLEAAHLAAISITESPNGTYVPSARYDAQRWDNPPSV